MWKIVLNIFLLYVLDFSLAQEALLCNESYGVSFRCPCPEELEECVFKKLFKSASIMSEGSVKDDNYELDVAKTHVVMKKCGKDDEGTYVWNCKKCNKMSQYHLQVQTVNKENLICSAGGEIAFKCPCCETELSKCSFQKGQEYFILKGELKDTTKKYIYDQSHITLQKCETGDQGEYVWNCESCSMLNLFYLEVLSMTSSAPASTVECLTGNDASFTCPCCIDNLDSCSFRKLLKELMDVVVEGKPVDWRFKMDNKRSGVMLRNCSESDAGVYEWVCGKCLSYAKFILAVPIAGEKRSPEVTQSVQGSDRRSKATPTSRPTPSLHFVIVYLAQAIFPCC